MLSFAGEALERLEFTTAAAPLYVPKSDSAAYAVAQIELYFRNPRWPFEISLELQGTEFQQRVWGALREIPAGTTLTYGQLAWRLDSSPRAVGGACRANPIPLIVPCHRVVAADGIGGFMGARKEALDIKQWLLRHEGEHGGG